MKKPKNEEEMVTSQPIDKIDKNLRHIFGLLIEKDWKMAQSLVNLMKEGEESSKQMAEGFGELIDFLKVFSAGKETKAAMRGLDSLILNDEIDTLMPEMDVEELNDLRADIASKGILAPLIVQDSPEGPKLVDGYTRYRIAKELGLKRVPIVSVTPLMDARLIALALNLLRRQVSKETRDALIKKIPIPKVGRPKIGEKVISKADLAKELGVSESTIKRSRREKRGQKGENDPFSKVCDKKSKEKQVDETSWINIKDLDVFNKMGYIKGVGYCIDFTKDQLDFDYLVRCIDRGMQELLKAIKDAGLESQVEKYRMTVSFEARKKERKE